MADKPVMADLADTIAQQAPVADHPALFQLVDKLRESYGQEVCAVLFYGSCLRSGDPHDGLVDLYLVVDSYRGIGQGLFKSFWNALLPPNVFYAEHPVDTGIIRCKYAILSLRQLEKGTSKSWYQSYLWGRFCQPTALAWSRDTHTRHRVENCLAQATLTFLDRSVPAAAAEGDILSLWTEALQLSYHTELRPESSGRAEELVRRNGDYYRKVITAAAPLLAFDLHLGDDGSYRSNIDPRRRRIARGAWKLRSLQGKLLSLARLTKALFTFEGGLDYAAWKLERHSGQKIDIPGRVRRWPLIFVWGLVWKLYRKGVFR